MRLFFGFDVTPEIRNQLTNVRSWLESTGVRAGNWSRPELFHLTLLFIGDTSEENVSVLAEMGKATAEEASPFTIRFEQPGMFERNRILWYGIKEDSGMQQMRDVHRRITNLAKKEPFIKVDERPFRPHLTLARKLDSASIPLMREVIARTGQSPVKNSQVSASSSDGVTGYDDSLVLGEEGAKTTLPNVSSLTVNSICLFESRQIDGRLMYPVVERYAFRA